MTPYLSGSCPISNARSRILDRRQTENEVQRNFYVVEITPILSQNFSASNGEDEASTVPEVVHVDLSRILEYVSLQDLENFENEQFSIEAAAEMEVLRQEAEELARRRLERNARSLGTGKGSRLLSGLGLDLTVPTRGRPRGRGGGRGRGSWRGRGALLMTRRSYNEDMQVEEDQYQRSIPETDSEEDSVEIRRAQTSPGITRSAFVANSALPVSPVAPHRNFSNLSLLQCGSAKSSDINRSNGAQGDSDTRSTSSVAVQLRLEHDSHGRTFDELDEKTTYEDRRRSKRRRMESTASDQPQFTRSTISRSYTRIPLLINQSPGSMVPDEGDSEDPTNKFIPTTYPSASHRPSHHNNHDENTIHVQPFDNLPSKILQHDSPDEGEAEAEEYVVEAIIEHFYNGGKKYYLVKWEDYEDSHDWLSEEDLGGAAELVADYNERINSKKEKENSGEMRGKCERALSLATD